MPTKGEDRRPIELHTPIGRLSIPTTVVVAALERLAAAIAVIPGYKFQTIVEFQYGELFNVLL